jgi:hypothetical protein
VASAKARAASKGKELQTALHARVKAQKLQAAAAKAAALGLAMQSLDVKERARLDMERAATTVYTK